MPQSHPLHHMRRYCFWLITKTILVADHPFPTGFSSYVNLREDFSHPNKNANSQQSLCASWYGWHHRKEAPESFGANCPVHGTYLNPNWDLYKVFKETARLLFTGELRGSVEKAESDGRLSSFTLPLGGPWGFSLHKTESNIPLFNGKKKLSRQEPQTVWK